MVIDIHTHFGTLITFSMPEKMVIESIKKYNINFILTSNIEGIEFDQNGNKLPFFLNKNQIQINKKAINFARKNKEKIGVLLWIRPHFEKINDQFLELIENNLDIIYGIKFHPFYSRINIEDTRLKDYLEICKKYKLVFCLHTAYDGFSDPVYAYNTAKKNPDINFVLYHMGLQSDNIESMKYIKELPNLYGDTCWVKPENILKAIDFCGDDKILFGSDNPIDGIDTYNNSMFYKEIFENFEQKIEKKSFDKLLWKNAKKLFNIEIK